MERLKIATFNAGGKIGLDVAAGTERFCQIALAKHPFILGRGLSVSFRGDDPVAGAANHGTGLATECMGRLSNLAGLDIIGVQELLCSANAYSTNPIPHKGKWLVNPFAAGLNNVDYQLCTEWNKLIPKSAPYSVYGGEASGNAIFYKEETVGKGIPIWDPVPISLPAEGGVRSNPLQKDVFFDDPIANNVRAANFIFFSKWNILAANLWLNQHYKMSSIGDQVHCFKAVLTKGVNFLIAKNSAAVKIQRLWRTFMSTSGCSSTANFDINSVRLVLTGDYNDHGFLNEQGQLRKYVQDWDLSEVGLKGKISLLSPLLADGSEGNGMTCGSEAFPKTLSGRLPNDEDLHDICGLNCASAATHMGDYVAVSRLDDQEPSFSISPRIFSKEGVDLRPKSLQDEAIIRECPEILSDHLMVYAEIVLESTLLSLGRTQGLHGILPTPP